MLRSILARSRYLILIAVIGSLLASVITALGGAIGLVLFALGYLLNVRSKINRAGKQDETDAT